MMHGTTNIKSKFTFQSCFSLGYKLLYIDFGWGRRPLPSPLPTLMLGERDTMQAVIVRELLWSAVYLCPDHVLDCGRTWAF